MSAKRLVLSADKSIDIYQRLIIARKLCLQPALAEAINAVGVVAIDIELHQFVEPRVLNHLASLGLRGELVFPVPSIIKHNPSLLGYYRMLLGFSQKDFGQGGYATWLTAEKNGKLSKDNLQNLTSHCEQLIKPLAELVMAMDNFKDRDLNDLALLTLGPTLQGARNDEKGMKAEREIFATFRQLVEPWITFEKGPLIRFKTPQGNTFELIHGSDPDVRLQAGTGQNSSPILATEIQGGSDHSNAYNRAGEAEKSHVTAKAIGYANRWTIIKIAHLSRKTVVSKTPSSTEVFEFDEISQRSGTDWIELQQKFLQIIGMAGSTNPS